MKVTVLLTSLLVLLMSACASNTPTDHGFMLDQRRIDSTLNKFIDDETLVGVSALVHVNGKEKYFGAFGYADREAGKAMRRDTLVQIFSMTKPVTGVALMTLYEEGKLDLDLPLSFYLPEFANIKLVDGLAEDGSFVLKSPQREPSVYDVLRHTAGFVSSHAGESALLDYEKKIDPGSRENTLTEFSQKLAQVPLLDEPGTQWLYGPSVNVQATLVEKLSGMPFDTYVKQTIFEPLGMDRTTWVASAEQLENLAALYQWHEDGSFTRENDAEAFSYNAQDWPMKYGSWGLVSTLDDYARFAQMLVNEGSYKDKQILQASTVKLMATDALPGTVKNISWLSNKGQVGFGIDFAVRIAAPASREEASGEVGEFFWDGAANTLFWIDPVNKLTAVLFTQYRPFGKVPIHKAFRDAVYANDETASVELRYPEKETN